MRSVAILQDFAMRKIVVLFVAGGGITNGQIKLLSVLDSIMFDIQSIMFASIAFSATLDIACAIIPMLPFGSAYKY